MRNILSKSKWLKRVYHKFKKLNTTSKISFTNSYWFVFANEFKIKAKSNSNEQDNNKKALWVIPDFNKGSGGHLNILRFVFFIKQTCGIDSDILIFGNNQWNNDPIMAKQKINEFFYPFDGNVSFFTSAESEFFTEKKYRYVFATSWQTAYCVKLFNAATYKLYFIQDFEPFFYALGSEYSFAEQTYKFGFIAITAGGWLSDLAKNNYGMDTFSFNFAFEPSVQDTAVVKLSNFNPRILFYARPPTLRRGFELGVFALSELYRRFSGNLDIVFVGWDVSNYEIPFKYENLGIVEYSELNALYTSCDAALVLSFTNMSLLPLEILSCGCEVVLNSGDNNTWLDNGLLFHYVEPDICQIADKLEDILKSRTPLKYPLFERHPIRQITWAHEGQRVGNYLLGLK